MGKPAGDYSPSVGPQLLGLGDIDAFCPFARGLLFVLVGRTHYRSVINPDVVLHQFEVKLIKHALAQPVIMIAKFAATLRSVLRLGVQRVCLTVQEHHVVLEIW
ncbi:MAG: hypothetical protein ACR2PG_25780 [Hyphomicrobiaceae bacterium]